jgi:hypothetical protein
VKIQSSLVQEFRFVSDYPARCAHYVGFGLGENGKETKDRLRLPARVAVVFFPGSLETDNCNLAACARKMGMANWIHCVSGEDHEEWKKLQEHVDLLRVEEEEWRLWTCAFHHLHQMYRPALAQLFHGARKALKFVDHRRRMWRVRAKERMVVADTANRQIFLRHLLFPRVGHDLSYYSPVEVSVDAAA